MMQKLAASAANLDEELYQYLLKLYAIHLRHGSTFSFVRSQIWGVLSIPICRPNTPWAGARLRNGHQKGKRERESEIAGRAERAFSGNYNHFTGTPPVLPSLTCRFPGPLSRKIYS